jgi:hypothetical protein
MKVLLKSWLCLLYYICGCWLECGFFGWHVNWMVCLCNHWIHVIVNFLQEVNKLYYEYQMQVSHLVISWSFEWNLLFYTPSHYIYILMIGSCDSMCQVYNYYFLPSSPICILNPCDYAHLIFLFPKAK